MSIIPIPQADVDAAQARIGNRRPVLPWHDTATASAIRNFAGALGDDNPLWWDDEHARGTRWGGIVAPPSYLYSCTNGIPPGAFAATPSAGEDESLFPGAAALWFGDDWEWQSLLQRDEPVSGASWLESIERRDRANGEPRYLVKSCTAFQGRDGRDIGTLTRTMMYFARDVQEAGAEPAAYSPPRYSDEQIAALVETYEAEYASRSGANTPAFESVAVGQAIGPLTKGPLTVSGIIGWMMGWGSSLLVTNRLSLLELTRNPGLAVRSPVTNIPDSWGAGHWDAAIARETGLPDGYDFGAQRIAWASHLLTDWIGDGGELRTLAFRLKRPNLLGDTTTFRGAVIATEAIDQAHGMVTVRIEAHNQKGELTGEGEASCSLPRAASGHPGSHLAPGRGAGGRE